MNRAVILLITLLSLTTSSMTAQAFPCIITVMKDTCWTKYNVTVSVMDAANDKELTKVIIPTGSSWGRREFVCQPKQTLRFQAKFMPVFWEQDRGKVYRAHHYWTLPEAVQGEETAWHIKLCYPEQFAEVPLPPEAGSHCQCESKGIPPIAPR